MAHSVLKIGTRRSDLALVQTNLVAAALRTKVSSVEFEVVPILTAGDKNQGTPAAAFGDKKDWVAEIELALNTGEIDFAVHSAKDVPIEIDPASDLLPVLPRESPFDILIVKEHLQQNFHLLPRGAELGTASLRRVAQLRRMRPDLSIRPLRGNVPTRIRRLGEDETLAGIVLAEAGVSRLNLATNVIRFTAAEIVPAVNQGILATQFLSSRTDIAQLLMQLVDARTRIAFDTERACVAALGADCKSALGVFASVGSGQISLLVRVLAADGSELLELSQSAGEQDALVLGAGVGGELIRRGAGDLLAG